MAKKKKPEEELTQDQIRARIRYHESGAVYYRTLNDGFLVRMAERLAAEWRAKLKAEEEEAAHG